MARGRYELLGLDPARDSAEDVKRAYRERLKHCHPDLHPGDAEAAQQTQRLNDAVTLIERTPPAEKARAADARRAARVGTAAAAGDGGASGLEVELKAEARRFAREWVAEREAQVAKEEAARAADEARAAAADKVRVATEAAKAANALRGAARRAEKQKQAAAVEERRRQQLEEARVRRERAAERALADMPLPMTAIENWLHESIVRGFLSRYPLFSTHDIYIARRARVPYERVVGDFVDDEEKEAFIQTMLDESDTDYRNGETEWRTFERPHPDWIIVNVVDVNVPPWYTIGYHAAFLATLDVCHRAAHYVAPQYVGRSLTQRAFRSI